MCVTNSVYQQCDIVSKRPSYQDIRLKVVRMIRLLSVRVCSNERNEKSGNYF